jgi:CelD/BcsL family acetyltransferase involved in cellulose biosynthesis
MLALTDEALARLAIERFPRRPACARPLAAGRRPQARPAATAHLTEAMAAAAAQWVSLMKLDMNFNFPRFMLPALRRNSLLPSH